MKRAVVAAMVVAAVATAQPPDRGRGWTGNPRNGRFLGAEPGRPGRVVKNAPYSADMITETTQALPDGNRIHQTVTSRFYRDSDGRTRREQSLNGLSSLAGSTTTRQIIIINDPVARVAYSLDPVSRTGTRSVAGAPGEGRKGPGSGRPHSQDALDEAGPPMHSGSLGNVKSESLGRQTIEGVPADGTRTTLTIPAGQQGNEQPIQVVNETWYSPDLQTVVLSKRTDPRSGETVFRMTNVSRTEPARSLFEPPADFSVSQASRPVH
jgi:hypothetical protein